MSLEKLPRNLAYLGVIAVLAVAVGFVMARGTLLPFPVPGIHVPGHTVSEYDAKGFLLVASGLAIVAGFFLVPRLAHGLEHGFLLKLLLLALAAKIIGSLVRLWTGLELFGFSDVNRYHRAGQFIGNQIRNLEIGAAVSQVQLGTAYMDFYAGVIYSIIGPTLFGAYLVYGLLSFLGSYFFYRAFRVAFPDGRYRLYGLLVFFFPALLYWPNGIGKDSMMILFIGIAAYGSAILLARGWRHGMVPLTIGLVSTATLRPEVTLMLAVGLGAALFLRKLGPHKSSIITRGIILIAGIGVMSIIIPSMMRDMGHGLEEVSLDGVIKFYEFQQGTTGDPTEGDAFFKQTPINDPLFVPMAFVTAFFRPFPWEAHRLAALIEALNGVLIMGLIVWRAPILGRAILGARSSPYVIFIVVFVVLLVFAMANFSNFGTFSRYRTMLFPLFFMLFAFAPICNSNNSIPEARTI